MTAHPRAVFLDSDIFVLDLRYPRDQRFHTNRRLLNALRAGQLSALTSIYNILEVCGILSFNLAAEELVDLYTGLADRYSVRVIFPPGSEGFICFSLDQIFSQIQKKMSFGDALVGDIVESEERSSIGAFLSWNAKHFAGKLAVEALTPKRFLAIQKL